MKRTLSKRVLSVLLSCLVVLTSFAGTGLVLANTPSVDDEIRTAFEEYVASTVFTDKGYSSTYSDAKLIAHLESKGYTGISIVGAGTANVQSYLQHAQAGFITGAAGYENLFAPQDGYVSVMLQYNGEKIGCVATIPAYTYDHTADITTVSKANEFTVENGTVTAYNGSANLLVIDKPISASINWGANAANIKAIVYSGGQKFTNAFHNGAAFGPAKLPNLAAFRFDAASFDAGQDQNLFKGSTTLTHVALPGGSGAYMIPHHFLAGVSSVVRLDNTKLVERIGWTALSGTNLNTIEAGVQRGAWWTDNAAFATKIGESGVTPVFILHHKNGNIDGASSGSNRWPASCTPIFYSDEGTYTKLMNSSLVGGKENADYRRPLATESLLKAVTVIKGNADKQVNIVPSATAALNIISGVLPNGITTAWKDGSFKIANGIVSGTVVVSDGTDTVEFDVSANKTEAQGTVQEHFEAYVASTNTNNALSSKYSDEGLLDYLASKGHGVTIVKSYLQHSKVGFTTGAQGYENLFPAQNGYVSVLLDDGEGNVSGYLGTIPTVTFDHTADITTVSKAEDFTVENGTITAYNGSANLLVIDKPISAAINWGANAANIKAIVYSGGQTFDANFHNGAAFGAAKLPNLAAFVFERANFATGGDVNLFSGNNVNLTHVSLPVSGVFMVPNHFLSGRKGVVRVDNTKPVERFGWYAFGGTSITSLEGGQDRDEIYTDGCSFYTTVAAEGVHPVFTFYNKAANATGPSGTMARWNVAAKPVIYATEATRNNVLNNGVAGMKMDADWKLLETSVASVAAIAKGKLDSFGVLAPSQAALLNVVNAALPEGYTAAWTAFDASGENVIGAMIVSDGTYSVTFNVNAPKAQASGTLEDAFREYVRSTFFTDSGLSSTYSDAKLVEALALKGFDVTVKDSYLQHAKAGFTTGAEGYETLFDSADGYVSVIMECGGEVLSYVETIPCYTYKHPEITTVSKAEDFTVVDDVITAYKGNANIVILDKPIAGFATMDWNGDAEGIANNDIKVIIYKGNQQFNADHSKSFGAEALPNLAAVLFENGSFSAAADIKMFQGAQNLTHVSLPAAGTFMVPNWFLTGVASVVRVDNTAKVERFGWWAFNGTNIITAEGGMGRGELYTDSLSFNTLAMNKGVTPVFTFYHEDAAIAGPAGSEPRWAANDQGVMPIIYTSKAMYEKLLAAADTEAGGKYAGWFKNPGDWRNSEDMIAKVVKVVADFLDTLAYVGKNGDDLIEQVKSALAADPTTAKAELTLSWNGTWQVEGTKLSGKLTVSDASGASATIPFDGEYKMAITDSELKDILDDIVPNVNVNNALQFAAQIADEAGCDPSGIFVRDFYFLRPEPGVKDADGILLPGRKGYAAVAVSATGSGTVYTKTWVIEPEIEDLGRLTVSSDDEFEFIRTKAGAMNVSAYNGEAQKIVIPAVGAKISGNWTVKNKENVQVVVMNNHSGSFEGGIFHDFPNLKVVIFNDEAGAWHTADDEQVPYTATFKNVPSLKYVQWGQAWREYPHFATASSALEALPLPRIYVEQAAGRKFSLSSFSTTALRDVVIPAGYQTSGDLAAHQKLFRIGDTAKSLCEAWVRAQFAAEIYDGAVTKDYLTAELKASYGSAEAITATWSAWNETANTADVMKGTIDATYTLTDGTYSFDVTFKAEDVAIGLGETVADRLQSVINNYNYTNTTTAEDLEEALTTSLLGADGYGVTIEEFYRYKSIKGAKDKDGILVPGTDGVVTAVVTLNTPDGDVLLFVNAPIKAQYDTLTFNSVSTEDEFTILEEDGNKVVISYDGNAEKIIIPEGVTEIDMFWFDANPEGREKVRAVVFPSTLKVLPYAVCDLMKNLEAAYIHDNTVTDPMNDEYAFNHCYMLQYVHLPEGWTEIPVCTFNHAKSLTAVHIPGNVTYIGESAFCSTSVGEMVFAPEIQEIAPSAFLGSYSPGCNIGSMDLTFDDLPAWIEISKNIVEHARELVADRGSYYRIFTILNNQMMLSQNSLRGGGLPTHRGSHILVSAGGEDDWTYDDLVAYGYLEREEGGNFDGGSVAGLEMTVAQAAAFAQYYVSALVLDSNANADVILENVNKIVSNAEGVTAKWSEEFKIEGTKATGMITLSIENLDTFAILLDETVKIVEPDDGDDDNTGDDNTGDDNTGDDNTGDDNTGDDNTGDDNTGDGEGAGNDGDGDDNNQGDEGNGDGDIVNPDEGYVVPTVAAVALMVLAAIVLFLSGKKRFSHN